MDKRHLAFLLALGLSFSYPALADGNSGLTVEDGSGNAFMEEVVDPEQQAAEEKERTRILPINRRTLTEQELKNVGIQMTPSGSLVPLINKDPNASPVKQYSSHIEQTFQALPTPILPYYPAGPSLYGAGVNPYASSSIPYAPGLNPYAPSFNPYNSVFNPYRPGLNAFGTGLNLYRNGFNPYGPGINFNGIGSNSFGQGFNTNRTLNPSTRQIIGNAIPLASAAIGTLTGSLNGGFNPPFSGLMPPLFPSGSPLLNGPLFNPYSGLPYTSPGIFGYGGNTGLLIPGTREIQTTTSVTPILPDWATH